MKVLMWNGKKQIYFVSLSKLVIKISLFIKKMNFMLTRLTLNTLIEQSLSASSSPVLDDRNSDVTNFIVTLEHALSFRMRGNQEEDHIQMMKFIFCNRNLVVG